MLAMWPESNRPLVVGNSADMLPSQSGWTNSDAFRHEDYLITPLADFSITARILGVEKYYFDRGAELSPIDLALGWNRMSDPEVLRHFDISQGGRWYRWRLEHWVIPRSEIIASSANMHMIPANSQIEKRLKKLRKNQTISITGQLVAVAGDNNFQWRSSLSRTDSGNGSCELVWVESIAVLN